MQFKRNKSTGLTDWISSTFSRLANYNVETNLEHYSPALNAIERIDLKHHSQSELRSIATTLRARSRSGEPLDGLLADTFALVRESAFRELGLEAYYAQLTAGIVLHHGKLAQMQTGEGKTLAAVFTAFLNALTGCGVHIMTANDYLARRDAEWMGPIFTSLGMTVGTIQETQSIKERKSAYACDVTYLTTREGGFDFLRDRLRYSADETVQRPFHMAIIDEADFIMIDEARVPLVIAGESPGPKIDANVIESVIPRLSPNRDFTINKNHRIISITPAGEKKVSDFFRCDGMHEPENLHIFSGVTVALHAHYLLEKNIDYIVRRNRIELIDNLTGRIADRRRWPYGIQNALEAKEKTEILPEGRIYGSITIDSFLSLYPKRAAMTATAVPAANEFASCFGLSTVEIPPSRPVCRVDQPDRIFATKNSKYEAIIDEIARSHETGRPVLVGTQSVKESERLAKELAGRGIGCSVLNARNDEEEANLIARAGMPGAVTISTNMAGRGTDIRLGNGNNDEADKVKAVGGLYVIGTSRHESVRVDNQLRGRAGRQGDPGSSCFFVSLEDELVQLYGIRDLIPSEYFEPGNDQRIEDRCVEREIARAQEIIEAQHASIRTMLRRYSALVEKERHLIHTMRIEALVHHCIPEALWELCAQHYSKLALEVDEIEVKQTIVLVFISSIDRNWSDHLESIEDIREGIHLERLRGKEPLLEFIRRTSDAFERVLETIIDDAADDFTRMTVRDGKLLSDTMTISGPSNTWTYITNDNPFPSFDLASLAGAAGVGIVTFINTFFVMPIIKLIQSVYNKLKNR